MQQIQRQSPVSFDSKVLRWEQREHWQVALEYEKEQKTLGVVDLSHRAKFIFNHSDIDSHRPFGLRVPGNPGGCLMSNGFLISRLNSTQAAIWHLFGTKPDMPAEGSFSDVTEAELCLALIGKKTSLICEKLSALDVSDTGKKPPFLLQGPFGRIPCRIVILGSRGKPSGMLFTCARGYAADMVYAVMEAGREFSLKPAGEAFFTDWITRF